MELSLAAMAFSKDDTGASGHDMGRRLKLAENPLKAIFEVVSTRD